MSNNNQPFLPQMMPNMPLMPNPAYQPNQSSGGSNVATSTPQVPAANQAAQTNLNANQPSLGNLGNFSSYAPSLINPSQIAQVQASTYQTPNIGNPAQYGGAQIGQTATLDPSMVQALTAQNTPDLSANSTIAQLMQAFQPEQQNAQAQLNNQLAQSGLSGGPAVAAQNQLSSQLTQALAPTLAQAIQQSQSNQLNAGQFSTTQLLNSLGANMSALNNQNQNQAQLQQQAGLANQSALNSNQQLYAQLNQQTGLANMDARNTANTTNAGALNSTLAANTSAQNQANQEYLSALLQQYQNQFSAFNSINDAGLNTQNQISASGANNFGTPASDPFGGLASSFASMYAPTAKAAATIPTGK